MTLRLRVAPVNDMMIYAPTILAIAHRGMESLIKLSDIEKIRRLHQKK
jgi:hypothetical protein